MNLEDTLLALNKHPCCIKINFMPLRMFIRSLIRICEMNLEDTLARFEKYSSKLDISRSLIRIFVGDISMLNR